VANNISCGNLLRQDVAALAVRHPAWHFINCKEQGEKVMKNTIAVIALAGMLFLMAGFNLDNAIVPKEEIVSGGVPKDGIPALSDPKFVPADEADFLEPDDRVIGVQIDGKAKAYPIKILNWHEVVNDTLSEKPIVITF